MDRYAIKINSTGNFLPKVISTIPLNLIKSIIDGVEIKALCDLRTQKAIEAKKLLENTDNNPDLYSGSEDEWKKLCQRKDIDLVIITTPWYMHTEMAVYAMEQGK